MHTYIFTLCPAYKCMYVYLYVFTYLDNRPNMQQLVEMMRIEHIEIASKWYELGLELVDSRILKVIRADHPNDTNTCCHVMFEKWLEMKYDASWSQLVTALDNIEMTTAAEAIRKLFKSGN